MEMVRDCLSKSRERCITSRYFYDLSENLEKLRNEVSSWKLLCPQHMICSENGTGLAQLICAVLQLTRRPLLVILSELGSCLALFVK